VLAYVPGNFWLRQRGVGFALCERKTELPQAQPPTA
jgi:hypothetical protein